VNMIRYAVKSINVINCLLAIAVAVAAQDVFVPWPDLKTQPALPAGTNTEVPEGSEPLSSSSKPFTDYVLVSEQNLFHRERKIPQEKKEEKPIAVVPPPELVLYGTLITDNLSIAYIEDKKNPHTTPGRGKRQTQMKKGDSVNGYVLKEIEPNRIVLVKGEEKLVVMLNEKDKIRSGETPAPATARPSTGASPARPAVSPTPQPALTPAAVLPVPAAREAGATTPRSPQFRRIK